MRAVTPYRFPEHEDTARFLKIHRLTVAKFKFTETANKLAIHSRLYLFRHGLTEANREGRFVGHTRAPLSREGIDYARKIAQQLTEFPVSAVYSSPVYRALETATIVAETLKLPVKKIKGLEDINIPEWDGKRKDELLDDPSTGYAIWKRAPDTFIAPGAETLGQLQKRGIETVERILVDHPGQTTVAVTHTVLLKCIILHYSKRPLSDYRSIQIAHTSPLVLVCHDDNIYIDS